MKMTSELELLKEENPMLFLHDADVGMKAVTGEIVNLERRLKALKVLRRSYAMKQRWDNGPKAADIPEPEEAFEDDPAFMANGS